MAKIFMIGFVFRGISYASNVFCQERQNIATYHLKMAAHLPRLFVGTLILEKRGTEFHLQSPSDFNNKELLPVLIEALRNQESA